MADKVPPIGKLITTPQVRDAIHIAIVPVRAAAVLLPGDHVGLCGRQHGVDYVDYDAPEKIGIVDPFLKDPVQIDQQFFLCLYPNTITSLAHHWTHPAFEPVKTVDTDYMKTLAEEVERQHVHLRWMESFAELAELPLDELMAGAKNFVDHGEYLCDEGRWEGFGVPDEFWEHYEAVARTKVAEEDRGGFFTCSC